MENRNENGRGIFYGVIGVATLVVAMIGATFAYFSAETGTGNNAITATAANITLEMGTIVTEGLKNNIIPVNEEQDGFATGGYVGVGKSAPAVGEPNTPRNKNCVDDDGNEFCSVYTFTVRNPSTTTAQKIYAQMDVITNTFESNGATVEQECGVAGIDTDDTDYCGKSNFAFAIFKGTADDVDKTVALVGDEYTGGWDVDGDATSTYYGPTAVPTSGAGDSMTGGVMMYEPTKLVMSGTGAPVQKRIAVTQAPDRDPILTNNIAGTAVLGKAGDMVVRRTPVPALSDGATHTFRLAALDQTLKPQGEVTYTVVMWLHENNENQQNDETKSFAGGITFSTSLGGSGVTAVLAATGIPSAG